MSNKTATKILGIIIAGYFIITTFSSINIPEGNIYLKSFEAPTYQTTSIVESPKKLERSCENTEILEITYPRYWKGLDLTKNGLGVIDPTQGEFPSIIEYYLTGDMGTYIDFDRKTKVIDVPYEKVNLFNLRSDDCSLVLVNEETYILCNSWLKTVSNTNDFVSTDCRVDSCGKVQDTKCLFPDYIPHYIENIQSKGALCILENDYSVCNAEDFADYIYHYYKLNLSIQ